MIEIDQRVVQSFTRLFEDDLTDPRRFTDLTQKYRDLAYKSYVPYVRPDGHGYYPLTRLQHIGSDRLIMADYDPHVARLVQLKLQKRPHEDFIPLPLFYLLRHYHTLNPHLNGAGPKELWGNVYMLLQAMHDSRAQAGHLVHIPEMVELLRTQSIDRTLVFAKEAAHLVRPLRHRPLSFAA